MRQWVAAGALAFLAAGGGCAEMRQAPPPPPPAGLVPATADPLRAALDAAAEAFADRGAGLAGRPAAAAQAVAQLEYLAATLPTDLRYARLAESVGRDLILARDEARNAVGVLAGAPAPAVIRGLLAAASALRAGDAAGAARAMPAPLFRPGGADSVARLGELGPLPQAAIATLFARQTVARVEALGSGGSTRMIETGFATGPQTTNFEGAISSVGY